MKLLLISKSTIIIQIFSLICEKQSIEISIQESSEIIDNYDLIVLDEEYINADFNRYKLYTKRLGVISQDKLGFDKESDFEITRPFLPKQLNDILDEQISHIKNNIKRQKDKIEEDESLIDINEIHSYVDSLADDIAEDIGNDNDESIVTLASLNDGGVLDSSELTKINQILLDSNVQDSYELEKNDWKDLSSVIDDALSEVRDYEFSEPNDQIELVLSKYNLDELSPLFSKVDQTIIDRLTKGEIIDLKLSLKG
ncbi:MAG: hypothetical protein HRT42_06735 [Campylobacteraceae bacterium]|nr:hypothetical protein [Campylobacteraceae bacterium]